MSGRCPGGSGWARIHNLIPAADTTFLVHFPIPVPAFTRLPGSDANRSQLSLGAIHIDFRVLTASGSVARVSAFDRGTRIADFTGLNLTGNQPGITLELESIQPIAHGLDVVLALGTPLGASSGFEFHAAGVTLVTAAGVLDVVDGGINAPQ